MNTEDKLRDMMDAARAEESVTHAEWTSFAARAHRTLYMRRAALAVSAAAIVGLGVVGASTLLAEDRMTAPMPPVNSPQETVEPTSTPTREERATDRVRASEQEVWLVQGEILSWGSTLRGGRVSTDVVGDDPVVQKAAFWLQVLLDGPSSPDTEVGATTAIPEGTELLHVARDGSTLEVDLSSEFTSGGGSLAMQMRVAQVVYTATQFGGIDSVRILIDGERVDAIGGEGVPPGGIRRDFQSVAPAIVLESPKPGDEISSPVTVSGFANTFEATVVIRITDANGDELTETFTTATCGSGCWGDFSEEVEFDVTERHVGRLVLLTYSAEDGSERDVISIPVVLVP